MNTTGEGQIAATGATATTTRDKLPKREKMKLKWKMQTQGSGPKVSLYLIMIDVKVVVHVMLFCFFSSFFSAYTYTSCDDISNFELNSTIHSTIQRYNDSMSSVVA